MGRPSKWPIRRGHPDLSNTQFLGRIRVHNPNGMFTGSAIFAGLTIVTDRPRYSVYNDRPHLGVYYCECDVV